MDYDNFNQSQNNSVFMPGLTRRGPVYNSLGALPVLSPTMKFAAIAALLGLGYKKVIPMWAAGAGALALWQFFPSAVVAAPVVSTTPPDTSLPGFDTNDYIGPTPAMPPIAQ